MLLDVTTLKGPELHMDVFRLQQPVLLLDLFTQRPMLHLDMSAQQNLSCTWACLDNREPLSLSLWRYRNAVHEKISWNSTKICLTMRQGIPRNSAEC